MQIGSRIWTSCGLAVSLFAGGNTLAQQAAVDVTAESQILDGLEWRCIGPSRGGRATAVCGVLEQPLVYYMGPTGGGVWKTENAGLTWQPVTDETLKTGSVGAIAVAPSDPNVVYVGMGERDPRGNVSHGDGMYKSTDAGVSWKHIGLSDSRHIGKIFVHPADHDLVYAAVMGHLFGPSETRGVYRSNDGGATWERVLYVDERSGAVGLAMDPNNARVLYAAFWQVRRTPWSLESGGPGSGLWKSVDGGDTWEELTEGLPEGIKGKIGVSVSPVDSSRVYAIVEARDGGVFRSDDAGKKWRRVNSDRELRQRAWYYTHIYADTEELDTVYVMNVSFHKSTDGGRNFDQRIRVPHGDNHDLWINPTNNRNMINANDGGANVSFDAGKSWTPQDGQATAQFYHVTVDNQFPYRVYGAQQDNSTISISSRNRLGRWRDNWYDVGGGESGYIAVRPDNPDVIYAGSYGGYLTRYDHRTKQYRNIAVWPDDPMGAGVETMKYRFQWTFPIVISPHDPDVLYVAGNHVFKSTNEGQSWEIISPDLTTNDKSKQASSGGPITKDNTSVEYYCTIFALAESTHEQGVIWAGSDDGLVHLTRDGGANWQEVTPAGLGEWSTISQIELSPHDAGTCYLAVNRYKMDDFTPYIFRTNDYGKTWKKITHGIAPEAFVRVVREDPARRGLLYAGTETGMYVSFDDGANWQSLQMNLPAVPITDCVVHENDLVISTQGRSFWILDNLTPLQQMSDDVRLATTHLFAPRLAYSANGFAAAIDFYLMEELAKESEFSLEFRDKDGNLIRKFKRQKEKKSSSPNDVVVEDEPETDADTVTELSVEHAPEVEQPEAEEPAEAAQGEGADQPEVTAVEAGETAEEEDEEDDPIIGHVELQAGLNRFDWNMRYADAIEVPGAVFWGGGGGGPAATPGAYQVRLTVNDIVQTQPLTIVGDPRLSTTQEEYDEAFVYLLAVRDKVDQAHRAVRQIRSIRKQVGETLARTKEHEAKELFQDSAKALLEKLESIESHIIQTKSRSNQDPLNFPIRLNDKIASLSGVVSRSNARPTDQAWAVLNELGAQLDTQLAQLDELIRSDVVSFNALVAEKSVPAIVVDKQEGERPLP